VGDWGDAGLSGKVLLRLEACTIIAELGKDLGRVDPAGAREGHHELAVGQCLDGALE
jgi:hypothetical protein